MHARLLKAAGAAAVGVILYLANASDTATGLALPGEASAVVGLPATPVSVAGVARRTTRRVVAVETTAVAATTAAAATAATTAAAQQQAATAQKQQAVAQQQAATAQQQAAVAQQQSAVAAQQQATAAQRPTGAPAVGSVVPSLPAGCTQVTRDGVAYQSCGGVFYRAAFQGNNLVYVVAQP
jgi:hypothetical protein